MKGKCIFGVVVLLSAVGLYMERCQIRRYIATNRQMVVKDTRQTAENDIVRGGEDGTAQTGQEDTDQDSQSGEEKVAYLTFDDGPGELTQQYLDVLKKHNAVATFFLIGQQIEDNQDIVRREIREGHEIGIHTWCHDSNVIYQSSDSYCQDVEQVNTYLKENFDYQAKLWRFPWGSSNCYISSCKRNIIERLQNQGLEYSDWNVSAEDSVGTPTTASIIENVKKDCFQVKYPVILMHDSNINRATLESLEDIIELLEEAGYRFDVLSNRPQTCHFGEYS